MGGVEVYPHASIHLASERDDSADRSQCRWHRGFDGVGDNLRFYQILNDIEGCVQGERTVQEYSIELDRLWLDHDYCTRSFSCPEPA
jgi:hypothetical protein